MTEKGMTHVTLTHQTAERLGRDIAKGVYKSGDRINEDEMIKLGISRTVFREAVRILEGKGMLYAKPLRGIRVTLATEWNLFDPDVAEWFGPSNTGAMFQNDARAFFIVLRDSTLPDDNAFYARAVDAVGRILKDAA